MIAACNVIAVPRVACVQEVPSLEVTVSLLTNYEQGADCYDWKVPTPRLNQCSARHPFPRSAHLGAQHSGHFTQRGGRISVKLFHSGGAFLAHSRPIPDRWECTA